MLGRGTDKKIYSANDIYNEVGESCCLGLPFFHAFTGCDSTSSFFEKSKKKLFEHWMKSEHTQDVTLAFQQLRWLPTTETFGNNIDIIEQFVATLYCKDVAELGHTRFEMILLSANNDFRKLPPSRRSLEQHVKRSSYQAGWVCRMRQHIILCRSPIKA